jgi:MacB-like periplasmic core domain
VKPAPSIRGLIWQCTLLLRAASLLVPKPQRRDWYGEWQAEVWHWAHFLNESGRLNPHTKLELIQHCWGAFADAAWHRFDQDRFMRGWSDLRRSARFCLGSIFLCFALVLLVTGFAATLRSGFKKLPYYQPDRVATLSFHRNFTQYHDGTLFKSVIDWSQRTHTASDVAGYSFHPASVSSAGRSVATLSAHVSPGFFELLGSRAAMGRVLRKGDETDCPHCIVLTQNFWKSQLQSDRSIVGKTLKLDDVDSQVIGILPEDFTFVFPEASVFTLPPVDPKIANLADQTGAILRLAPGASMVDAVKEFHQFIDKDASSFGYAKASVDPMESRARQGAMLYLLFTALALACGLALAGTRLSSARTRRLQLGFRSNLRWWSFLALKTLLLLSLCFVVSVELTGRISIAFTGAIQPLVGPSSTWFFLVTAMLALSWALHDQRRRCRICLKRLGNEASVGAPGYLLLDWWGTELVCSNGHGLLHVPEMKSSWLEIEQWVQLDESWKPLFEEDKPTGSRRD